LSFNNSSNYFIFFLAVLKLTLDATLVSMQSHLSEASNPKKNENLLTAQG
jgi:hypothetical protein